MKINRKHILYLIFIIYCIANCFFVSSCKGAKIIVNFDSVGGSEIESVEVVKGEKLLEPEEPMKLGYTFNGWYLGEEKFLFDSAVTGDMTLKAKWEANVYTVTLNKNGGVISENDVSSYTYGIGATLPIPERTGYIFGGWYVNAKFSGEAVSSISVTDFGNKTFNAKWVIKKFTITFDTDGGAEVASSQFVYNTTKETLNAITTTKEGYDFAGWTLENGDPITEITSNLTVKAKWTPKTYNVTLNKNGGTVNADDVTSYTYGEGATLPTNVTKTGYTFAGWFDNAQFSGTAVTAIADDTAGVKTFYAKWTPNTDTAYTVKFLQQNVSDDNYTEVEGDRITNLTGTTDSQTSFSTDKEYTGFTKQTIEQKTILGDGSTVIEVKYNRNLVAVTFVAEGESDKVVNVKYGSTFAQIEKKEKSNYTNIYQIGGIDVADDYEITEAVTITTTYDAYFTQKNIKASSYTPVVKNSATSYTISNPGFDESTSAKGTETLYLSEIAPAKTFEFSFKVKMSGADLFQIAVVLGNSDYVEGSTFTIMYDYTANNGYVEGMRLDPWQFNDNTYGGLYGATTFIRTGEFYVKYIKDGTKSWVYLGATPETLEEYVSFAADWNGFALESAIPAVKVRGVKNGTGNVTISEISYHIPSEIEKYLFRGERRYWAENGSYTNWARTYSTYTVGMPDHYTALEPTGLEAAENFTMTYKIKLPNATDWEFGFLYPSTTDYNAKSEYLMITPTDAYHMCFDGGNRSSDWYKHDEEDLNILATKEVYVKVIHKGVKSWLYMGTSLESMREVAWFVADWTLSLETTAIPCICLRPATGTLTNDRVTITEVTYTVDNVE